MPLPGYFMCGFAIEYANFNEPIIETVNDELKNIAQIKHSRYCSFNNFIANSLSAIATYASLKRNLDLTFVLSKTVN